MEAAIYATAGLLFVALLSGLGFLAVHYPKTFANLSLGLAFLTLAPVIAYGGYTYGLDVGANAAMAFVPPEKLAAAEAAAHSYRLNIIAEIACAIFALVMMGLLLVSHGVEREKKEIDRTRKRGK